MGAVVSTTVTRKPANPKTELYELSTAVQSRVVVPNGKVLSEVKASSARVGSSSRAWQKINGVSRSSVAVGQDGETAPDGPVASTVTLSGRKRVGGMWLAGRTLKVAVHGPSVSPFTSMAQVNVQFDGKGQNVLFSGKMVGHGSQPLAKATQPKAPPVPAGPL